MRVIVMVHVREEHTTRGFLGMMTSLIDLLKISHRSKSRVFMFLALLILQEGLSHRREFHFAFLPNTERLTQQLRPVEYKHTATPMPTGTVLG
jgi:hypothetical protein